jgi:hypothetical protein
MRWAVDDVLSYSAADAIVTPGVPMPRWGWNGLEINGDRQSAEGT